MEIVRYGVHFIIGRSDVTVGCCGFFFSFLSCEGCLSQPAVQLWHSFCKMSTERDRLC